jgi:hypothetical protein
MVFLVEIVRFVGPQTARKVVRLWPERHCSGSIEPSI